MVPKFALPQSLPQFRELFEQLASGDSLQILNNISNRELGWSSHETMHMIALTTFKKLDSEPLILGNLQYKLFKIGFDFCRKYFTAILDRPYHMVINIAH